MDPQIPEEAMKRLEQMIASDESPVGIDAKKTHILILHKLDEIERRIERIEREQQRLADRALD